MVPTKSWLTNNKTIANYTTNKYFCTKIGLVLHQYKDILFFWAKWVPEVQKYSLPLNRQGINSAAVWICCIAG